VMQLNPAVYPFNFPLKATLTASPRDLVAELAAVVAAAAEIAGQPVPGHLRAVTQAAKPGEAHRALAQGLLTGEKRAIWLGALASRHAAFADLRALAAGLAQLAGATLGRVTELGNAAGAYLAGAVPHREAGGAAVAQPGLNAAQMLGSALRAYLLVGGLEPSSDSLEPESLRTLGKAEFVVAVTPYASEDMKAVAHVLLPMGTFAETSGTFVSCEGRWQSQSGAAAPVGESRPGWKVLRVLGNLMNLAGFDYQSSEDVLTEARARCAALQMAPYQGTHAPAAGATAAAPLPDVAMYQTDAVVRRAASLQRTREARLGAVTY
jgi:NADH-quinone oxidoreductase subunit G